jgi:6-phosphogluconolactonase
MLSATRWHLCEDATAVAADAARRILVSARAAITERGVFRIVLAGGRTPMQTYRLLADAKADWVGWQVFFGDERCLPREDAGRNSRAAMCAWLERVPIPPGNVHPIPAELGAEAAAAAYRPLVRAALPFDLVTLGMGEDGHTASLFPGRVPLVADLTMPIHGAPKPPADRVSLSAEALSNAREILILVTGSSKRDAVAAWKAGDPLPVAGIGGGSGVDVLIDRDADVA